MFDTAELIEANASPAATARHLPLPCVFAFAATTVPFLAVLR